MFDKQLSEQVANIVEDCGFQLWACEYLPQGKHTILRVYIDHPNGISTEACQRVSRQVSAYLDVEDPISGGYSLEVSSPGLPRPLFTSEHYQKFIGQTVEIKLMKPIEKSRKIVGIIEALDENEHLHLNVDGSVLSIPLSNIVKAHLTD